MALPGLVMTRCALDMGCTQIVRRQPGLQVDCTRMTQIACGLYADLQKIGYELQSEGPIEFPPNIWKIGALGGSPRYPKVHNNAPASAQHMQTNAPDNAQQYTTNVNQ